MNTHRMDNGINFLISINIPFIGQYVFETQPNMKLRNKL